MTELLPTLLQTGATGVIAYLLIIALREQATNQRAAYRELLLQSQAELNAIRCQLADIVERNTTALTNAAQRLATLETICASPPTTRQHTPNPPS